MNAVFKFSFFLKRPIAIICISLACLLSMSISHASCSSVDTSPLWERADKLKMQGQYLLSSNQYSLIFAMACKDEEKGQALFKYAQDLYQLDEKTAAESSLQDLEKIKISASLQRKVHLLKAWYEPSFKNKLTAADATTFTKFEIEKVHLQQTEQLKKPWLAGTLSAVIPGMGQVYNENYSAAAMSFLLNSLFLATAIELHNKNLNTSALAAGVIFSITYTGNILGSVESSKQINKAHQEPLINQLRQETIPDLEL